VFCLLSLTPRTKGESTSTTQRDLEEITAMSLENVLVNELRDLYSAENQLVKALPKMAKGVTSPELKDLITTHLEETKGQVDRLKQIFEQLDKKPSGEMCRGMEGLVKEGQQQLENGEEGAAKDICIAGAALRVEHYEIAGYTAAIAIAKSLGQDEIVDLLTESLEEEEAAGQKVQAQAEPLLEEAASEAEGDENDDEGPADRAMKTTVRRSTQRATR
jgi:ferritin-like metal-binding protein YciE